MLIFRLGMRVGGEGGTEENWFSLRHCMSSTTGAVYIVKSSFAVFTESVDDESEDY